MFSDFFLVTSSGQLRLKECQRFRHRPGGPKLRARLEEERGAVGHGVHHLDEVTGVVPWCSSPWVDDPGG